MDPITIGLLVFGLGEFIFNSITENKKENYQQAQYDASKKAFAEQQANEKQATGEANANSDRSFLGLNKAAPMQATFRPNTFSQLAPYKPGLSETIGGIAGLGMKSTMAAGALGDAAKSLFGKAGQAAGDSYGIGEGTTTDLMQNNDFGTIYNINQPVKMGENQITTANLYNAFTGNV